MLSLLWQICDIIGLIFIVANGQILKTNLTIWSHWLRRLREGALRKENGELEFCSRVVWEERTIEFTLSLSLAYFLSHLPTAAHIQPRGRGGVLPTVTHLLYLYTGMIVRTFASENEEEEDEAQAAAETEKSERGWHTHTRPRSRWRWTGLNGLYRIFFLRGDLNERTNWRLWKKSFQLSWNGQRHRTLNRTILVGLRLEMNEAEKKMT